jgi:hypothetical protein
LTGACHRYDEAATLLVDLVSQDDATPELCVAAVKRVLAAGSEQCFAAAKAAVSMMLDRFPGDRRLQAKA